MCFRNRLCCVLLAVFGCSLDVVVSFLLYGQVKDFTHIVLKDFNRYTKSSLIDIWFLSVVRSTVTLGAVVATFISIENATHRLKKYKKTILILSGLLFMLTVIKLLIYSDKITNLDHQSWFWGLFTWSLVASIMLYVQWSLLSNIQCDSDNININSTEEECEPLIHSAQNNSDKAKNKTKQKTYSSVRRLIALSKSDWPYLLLACFFLVIAATGNIFVPYYTGQVIDGIAIEKSRNMFTTAIINMSLISVACAISSGLRGSILKFCMARLNIRVRNLLFASILKQDIGFFDTTQTGDITSRLTSDTAIMSESISLNLNIFVRSLVQSIGTCVFMFSLSWQMSLVTFIGLPVILLVSEIYGNYYKKLSKQVQDSLARANDVAEEICSTMRTVRSFANEDIEIKRYKDKLKTTLKLKVKEAVIYGGYSWCTQLFELSLTVSTLYYGGILVIDNRITGGHLVSFILYQIELGYCLESIGEVYTGLMQAVGASEKVFEYIDRKPAFENLGKLAPADLVGELEFKDVTFSYPSRKDTPVLKNVSFKVQPGEVVALVGPSGGGKSTCVNLIEHFYECASGSVLLDSKPIQEYDYNYLHKKIALVGQEPVLYARSIHENISYGVVDCDMNEAKQAASLANAHQFISEMKDGYDTQTGEKGLQLSGGQKQRIAIARALVRKPSIILLDEATSALDSESEHLVQQALYKNFSDKTVVIIAHRLSTVEKADKIIVISQGCVKEQGSHHTLLSNNGLYSALVQRQLLGITLGDDNNTKLKNNSRPTVLVSKSVYGSGSDSNSDSDEEEIHGISAKC